MSALRLRCVGLIALLALMLTTGDLPAQFVNVTASSGINLPPSLPTTEFGRGAAWADFDGDGDLDLMAPQGTLLPVLVFWNDGSGNFSSQIVGQLTALPSSPHACVAADFDNDGDQDAYICLGDGQTGPANILLVNQGAGVFVDQAALRGVGTLGCSYSASWGDFNRDGWLDLYVGNLYQLGGGLPGHTLYQNDGTGHF
ncbi:MAG: VCBS repeat-containing protein, partial [Planctomycetes bacterium]|nr:VCBS repeat-containing protein [Planctomycetota bacterium]